VYQDKPSGYTIRIYNTAGEFIRELNQHVQNGSYLDHYWDGKNMNNELVASGVYLIQFNSGLQACRARLLVIH
jgi:flagellar hook assembly protein FlgD